LGVDIAAIIALIFLRPKGNTAKTDSSKRIAGFALAALAVSAGIAGYMFTRPAMGLSQNAQNFANKNEKADLGILERDLGFVEPKSKHSLQFTLNNPTDRPLKITKIEKECKCTNFPDSIQEIAPHSSQKIEASFDTPDLRAAYSKRIILSTDSKEFPTVVLKVHARIGLPLNITPGKLDIAKIPAGETKHFPLTLTNEGEDPVQLLYSVASSSNVTVEVPRQTLARGQSAQLLAHFTSDPTSKNFIIRVHTDSTKQAIVEVIGQ
jgi:hypothetical protein